MNGKNTTIVISHYNEDLTWVERIAHEFDDIRIYTKAKENSRYNVPINVGNEASAYLLYIIDNYDSLKEYTLFLHAHEYSDHQNGSVVDLINSIKNMKTFYYNINNYTLGYILTNWSIEDLKPWYKTYLELECGPMESYGDWTYGHLGCAQFLVHADTIRSKTKRFYEDLYNWILTTNLPSSTTGRFLEWTWHLIWNQVPKIKQPKITITDLEGREILQPTDITSIDASNLANGLYILNIK